MSKVAGVTVVHNPKKKSVENIFSYINQLDKLYVVDNSETDSSEVTDPLLSSPNISLVKNMDNLGIAAALNIAAERAIKENFNFLLTMDEDSRISENHIAEMLKEFKKDENIGILSPFVIHKINPRESFDKGLKKITVAMTSGSIIRLSAYKKIGGFIEKYFIDYVDNEYCLRMQKFGYKVLELNSVHLYHRLGKPVQRRFLFSYVFPTNHPPIRWYYRTRNRFDVYKNYKNDFPDYIKSDLMVFLKDFIKILLYESEKMKKIRMIILCYKDYKKNNFGKFIERIH